MRASVVSRAAELRAVVSFLSATAVGPAGLVLEGEAGIGKTTLWLAAADQARERGYRLLSARAAQAESTLAYTVVADILQDVAPGVVAGLPGIQRLAVDRVLLRAGAEGPPTNHRVVAAAFVAVIEALAGDAPVVLAIDDIQWLDSSSNTVIAFAARRLRGRVGVLVTERLEPDAPSAAGWLQLGDPDGLTRVRVRPLSLSGLHTLFSEKLGRSFSRPTMVGIARASGGNPFYALELARALADDGAVADARLPGTLADLVSTRLAHLDADVRSVLLVAACVSAPTVDLLARAAGTSVQRIVDLLETAEKSRIVEIPGNRVQFQHPLLASGVYTDSAPAQRRAAHRALAEIEDSPELKARHLALASASEDPATLQALDAAADSALMRGAPAAAAELVNLAIGLGGDTHHRRIRAAEHLFQAGDMERSRGLLEPILHLLEPGTPRAIALNLLAAVRIYDNTFLQSVTRLKRAIGDAQSDPAVLLQTLMLLSFAQMNVDEHDESVEHARQAVELAEALGDPHLISQALTLWVLMSFWFGRGADQPSMTRALGLEDPTRDVPFPFRATAISALILAWTGQLEQAHAQWLAARRRFIERGADRDMMIVASYGTLIEIWRGRFGAAAAAADDAVERAEQFGGGVMLVIPLSVRAAAAAYAGREHDARANAELAIKAIQRSASARLPDYWATMALGFLEVSLCRYDDAMTTLQPLISIFDTVPGTEIITAWYLPDAIEAMISLGRSQEAEPLIEALERNGRRLDRPWMMAVGARCRGMWLAAHGDVEAAEASVQYAMTVHDRLPMPFERARTQLLLGQLQRRQRRKEAAAATLREALAAFEEMGSPLWAQRVTAELTRTKVPPSRNGELTPSEERVAQLAAAGMTNSDIAATLLISPKTVEHNLTRIYRKLGIRSRAQLGQRIEQPTRRT